MKEYPTNTNGSANSELDSADSGLLSDLAALPRAVQPVNDPWLKIASRIVAVEADVQTLNQKRNVTWSKAWLAVAASVLLVVISGIFIWSSNEPQGPVYQPVAKKSEDAPGLFEMGTRIPTSSVELEYQAAFREFVHFEAADSNPSSYARDEIRQGWELMLQLETELLTAMAREPENRLLKQRLVQLRAHQLQLLHVIADSGQAPRRNLI
jgi:hypothetical protein